MFSRRVAVANSKGWKGASSEHFSPPCGSLIALKTNHKRNQLISERQNKTKQKKRWGGRNTCPIINFLPSSPANIDKKHTECSAATGGSCAGALWRSGPRKPGGPWMGLFYLLRLSWQHCQKHMKALCFALNVTRSQWGELRFLAFFPVVPSGVLFWSRHIFYALKSDLYTMFKYSSSVTTAASPHNSSRVATLISSPLICKMIRVTTCETRGEDPCCNYIRGVNQIEPASFSSRVGWRAAPGMNFLIQRGCMYVCWHVVLIWQSPPGC